jgi:hypothetical protein
MIICCLGAIVLLFVHKNERDGGGDAASRYGSENIRRLSDGE